MYVKQGWLVNIVVAILWSGDPHYVRYKSVSLDIISYSDPWVTFLSRFLDKADECREKARIRYRWNLLNSERCESCADKCKTTSRSTTSPQSPATRSKGMTTGRWCFTRNNETFSRISEVSESPLPTRRSEPDSTTPQQRYKNKNF